MWALTDPPIPGITKAAVDAHRQEQVAALFTADAIFQGLHPYTVGPAGVAEY